MRECVAPSCLVDRTVLYWSYRVLPLVACLKVCALHDASARETEHSRLKRSDGLRYILAQSVLISAESLDREERDMLQVNRLARRIGSPFTHQQHSELCFLGSQRGGQYHLVLLPLRRIHGYYALAESLLFAHGARQTKLHTDLLLRLVARIAGPHAHAILAASLHANAEETLIADGCKHAWVTRVAKSQIVRIVREWTIVHHFHISDDVPSCKRIIELERAVLYQLRIQTSVSSEVDVFVEEAEHCLLDRNTL